AALVSARGLLEKLPAADQNTPEFRQQLGVCHYQLGAALSQIPARYEEADRAFLRAQEIFKELANENLAIPDYSNLLAAAYSCRGWLLLAPDRRPSEAEQILKESVALFEKLTADSKLLPDFRQNLGRAESGLGFVLMTSEHFPEAEAAYRKAQEVFDKLVQMFPHVARYHGELGSAQEALVQLMHRRGDLAEARMLAEGAIN